MLLQADWQSLLPQLPHQMQVKMLSRVDPLQMLLSISSNSRG